MTLPLFSDINNDKKWLINLLRILIFLLLFIIMDSVLSFTLLEGIDRNYGIKSNSDVLMIGHSHLMLAVDKKLLEKSSGLKVAKYTREGVNIADRKIMLEHYFITCEKKPEIVILSIDPWIFSGEGLSQNSWQLFLPFMDNPEVGRYVKESAPKSFDYFRYKFIRTSRFNSNLLNASIRGWMRNWDNLKFGVVDTARYSDEEVAKAFRKITFNMDLINEFSYALDFLAREETTVLLLNTPIWQPLLSAQKKEYDRSMFLIDSLAKKHCPNAEIIDFVPQFSRRTKLFYDPIHLNPEGQKAVTEYLSILLDDIWKSQKEIIYK